MLGIKEQCLGLISSVSISIQKSLAKLQWWCDDIEKAAYLLFTPNAKTDIALHMLHTMVRVQSWALKKQEAQGVRLDQRITLIAFELMAAFFGLKAFGSRKSVHIYIYLDNITAVNYLNSMGGTHSIKCNSATKNIWQFCIERDIWISAALIPGKNNT